MIIVLITETSRHLLDSLRAKASEWILTIAGVGFGYGLAQPVSTFDMSQSYDTMQQATLAAGLTEDTLGWSILVLSFARLIILAYNGLWTSSPIARRYLAFAFAVMWFMIFLGIWSAVGFNSTGTGVYLALVIGEVINTLRTSWEAGQILILDRGKVKHAAHSRH